MLYAAVVVLMILRVGFPQRIELMPSTILAEYTRLVLVSLNVDRIVESGRETYLP